MGLLICGAVDLWGCWFVGLLIKQISLQNFRDKIWLCPSFYTDKLFTDCHLHSQPRVTLSNYSSLYVHITSALSAKIATAIPPVCLTVFVVLSCSSDHILPNLVTCSRHVWQVNHTRLAALSHLRRKVAAVTNKYNDRIKWRQKAQQRFAVTELPTIAHKLSWESKVK